MSSTLGSTSDYAAFLRALEASPAMRPYAYGLRLLTDPRTHEERITAAVEQHLGAYRHLPLRQITSALQKRIAWKLHETSLAEPPCDKAIRERVRAILQRNGTCTPETPHALSAFPQASTIAST